MVGEDSCAVWLAADGPEATGSDLASGELAVWVQSPGWQVVRCDACGTRARSKCRREPLLRDAPASNGRPCEVRTGKRVWRCPDRGSSAGSCSTQNPTSADGCKPGCTTAITTGTTQPSTAHPPAA